MLCATLSAGDAGGAEVMRCVLLCMLEVMRCVLEAVEDEVCLLEVLEMMRCVLLCAEVRLKLCRESMPRFFQDSRAST